MPAPEEITQLLTAWGNGDRQALDRLIPFVEGELRRLARHYMMRERPDHTLQTTALINEAFLRLAGQTQVRWQNREHFYGIAAQLMRRILLDHAKGQRRIKRWGGEHKVSLSDVAVMDKRKSVELIALDEALNRLALIDERKSHVVELRYFGGLSVEETAEALDTSAVTVMRDWSMAKAWLRRELTGER
jgi:RNA polymerase sigma-70 factor (ECF subfamily)